MRGGLQAVGIIRADQHRGQPAGRCQSPRSADARAASARPRRRESRVLATLRSCGVERGEDLCPFVRPMGWHEVFPRSARPWSGRGSRQQRQSAQPDIVFELDRFIGTDKLARCFDHGLRGSRPVWHRSRSGRLPPSGERLGYEGQFDRLTAGQQEAWKEVLVHNRYECLGLRRMAKAAAEGARPPGH